MTIQGTFIVLSILSAGEYTTIAYGRGCSIDASRDFMETATTATADSREYVAERKSFTVQCKSLMSDDMTAIENIYRTGESIYFMLCDINNSHQKQFRGRARIKSIKQGASIHEMATAEIALQGVDELTYKSYNIVRLRDKNGTPLCDSNGLKLLSYISK